MKIFKKVLVSVFAILTACLLCIVPKTKNAESSSEADAFTGGAFSYASLSQAGQAIDASKLQTIDNSTYIVTNNSVTISLKPFQFRYRITANPNNFFAYTQKITLKKDVETDEFPTSFVFEGMTYYYKINASTLNISINPILSSSYVNYTVTSSTTDLLSFVKDENKIEISVITSYTSTQTGFVDSNGDPAKSCSFSFQIGDGNTSPYTLNIQKPVVNFFNLSEPVVMFNTFKTDDGGNPYPEEKSLAPDQVFNKLQITFLCNEYTEENPLYFNINYNGFVYEYTMFTKNIDGDDLIFVNYENDGITHYLATIMAVDEDGEEYVDTKIFKEHGGNTNNFSLTFDKTGRYEVEFFDSTYTSEFTNANHYSTSFFIREKGSESSIFQNIYIVAETLDDDGEHIDYIVSNSYLNNVARISIKNLDGFGKDADGNEILLSDVIEKIEVLTTDFGIDRVETAVKTYTVEEIIPLLVDNDLILNFSEDAYYQILIYPKNKEGAPKLEIVRYIFTIVRHAKTTFTFNGEPYTATRLYTSDVRPYTNPITSSINLNVKFDSYGEVSKKTLPKTYVNEFTITYGVKAVMMEKYVPILADDKKAPPGLYLKVYGVGDITVYLTINGQEQEPMILNSERGNNSIYQEGYGKYTVRIVDSMGTESAVYSYNIKKGLNTSALVLIALSSIIAAVVIIFILRARGKVATR